MADNVLNLWAVKNLKPGVRDALDGTSERDAKHAAEIATLRAEIEELKGHLDEALEREWMTRNASDEAVAMLRAELDTARAMQAKSEQELLGVRARLDEVETNYGAEARARVAAEASWRANADEIGRLNARLTDVMNRKAEKPEPPPATPSIAGWEFDYHRNEDGTIRKGVARPVMKDANGK